jgi:heme-degrading monooxygenase HmoA
MPREILSVAIYEPLPGKEAAALGTVQELIAILSSKGYSRDRLYHSGEEQYVLLRYWTSEESRRAAQEDPDVLRCWARLGNEIRIVKVYETLESVPLERSM